MPSANLAISYVAASQNQKEVTINAGFDAVDAAMTEPLVLDLSAGNVAVTIDQATRNLVLRCAGHTAARTLTLPQVKRELVIVNQGTALLTVARGAGSVAVPAGTARRVYMDGTVDGIIETGGGSGGAGGIPEAPGDGKLYGRKSGAWSEVPAAGGGVPEAPADGKVYGRKNGNWTEAPAGPKGDTGAAGPKGDTGAAGSKGDSGAAGAKGDTGAAGPKGDTGSAGAKGDKGDPGDTAANDVLRALMALNPTADSGVFFTGPTGAGLFNLNGAIRGLLGSASAGAMLTAMGGLPTTGGNLTGALTVNNGVSAIFGAQTPVTTYYTSIAIAPLVQSLSGGNAGMLVARYSNNATPGFFAFGKSRATSVGAEGATLASDQQGAITFAASNGTKMCHGARILSVNTAAPGADYVASALYFYASNGSTENLCLFLDGATGDLRSGGSAVGNTVISGARALRLRSYTAATLPAVSTAGEMIYVSDAAAGLRQAVSDTTTWRLPNGQDASLPAINSQTGTTYTLALGDMGRRVELNNAAAITVTIPPNASVAFPIGVPIELVQMGAGKATFVAGAGVTIRSVNGNLSLPGQYAGAVLRKRAADEWVLIGSLAA